MAEFVVNMLKNTQFGCICCLPFYCIEGLKPEHLPLSRWKSWR